MPDLAGRRRWRSVRLRIAVTATIVVAIVLVTVSVLLVARHRQALTEELDETLVGEADRIADAVASEQPVPVLDDDLFGIVVDDSGTVLVEVGDTAGRQAAFTLLLEAADRDRSQVTVAGEAYRVVSMEFAVAGDEARVVIAQPTEDIDESIGQLSRSLWLIVPPALLVLAVVVWLIVGRTLRAVELIRSRVAAIDVHDLDQRVPVPPGDDEIARLADTMNAMLERLERSVRRQQRFVADASHELRTPLTRMRTELEVDERHPAGADPALTRRSQLEEIAGMQRMIDDLLLLARGDAGSTATPRQMVDLDDVVLDEIGAQPPSSIAIDAGSVSAAQVPGSPGELRRVVRNLLDNARQHTRTMIRVELAETADSAVLTISDDGPGIPHHERERVLERFSRLDDARSGGEWHAGLGLAIVHEIVSRHAGTLTIGESEHGGVKVTVRLPNGSSLGAGDDDRSPSS
jgi:signal transduction histidine kinase